MVTLVSPALGSDSVKLTRLLIKPDTKTNTKPLATPDSATAGELRLSQALEL
jgi:hypothetical protein